MSPPQKVFPGSGLLLSCVTRRGRTCGLGDHTGAVVLNFLFVSKLGSSWGISGRRVGESGRKAPWNLVFPRKLENKERMGILPTRLFFPFRLSQPGPERGGLISFNFKGFPLVRYLNVCVWDGMWSCSEAGWGWERGGWVVH